MMGRMKSLAHIAKGVLNESEAEMVAMKATNTDSW